LSLITALGVMCFACGKGGSGNSADSTSTEDQIHGHILPNDFQFRNPNGLHSTVSTAGSVDLTGPFFQSFGTNQRTCGSCHAPEDAWTVTPRHIEARFDRTDGNDPIFRTNDGSVCPNADVSTEDAREAAYALLLSKGLIRVGIGIPDGADFTLVSWEGTYCNDISNAQLSMFRRPLPSTNLAFNASVMWDGRETVDAMNLTTDFGHQANDATLGHAQATQPLPDAARDAIVAFETGLFTAQSFTFRAHSTNGAGANGGATFLSTVPFMLGINDNPHSQTIFTLYDSWANLNDGDHDTDDARAAVQRGQDLFNNKTFEIKGVAGQDSQDFMGQCGTCHETPNVGNYPVNEFFAIGVADAAHRTSDLPLYTFQETATGNTIQVSDPGRALITGKFADIGEFKPGNLRGLSGRAPYFHNGFASDLDDVVDFYNDRFNIGFTEQEHDDLVAFLKTL
jgi:hypothetical protein